MYNYIDEVPEEIQEQADAYFNHEDALPERVEQQISEWDESNINQHEEVI